MQNTKERKKHTPINILLNKVLNRALVSNTHRLLLDRPAPIIEALGLVHGLLQGVALPAKHVVGVGARAVGAALEAPHEGVLVRLGVPEVVELGGVPLDLEGNLGDADGVRRGTGGRVGEALGGDGVVHVGLVVGGVEVFAVPAAGWGGWLDGLDGVGKDVVNLRGKVVGGKDAVAALSGGEGGNNGASAAAAHALVAETPVGLVGLGRAADCHAEAGGEGLDRLLLEVVLGEVELGVVDGESALGAVRASQQRLDRLGQHPVIGAVLGVLEVQVGHPVVAKIVRHLARGAGCPLSDITVPGGCVLVSG